MIILFFMRLLICQNLIKDHNIEVPIYNSLTKVENADVYD